MRDAWRRWGITTIAWLGVLGLAGAALAGAEGDEATPTATLSPAEVTEGKALDSGEAFEMTLHLSALPETDYDLAITYGGDPIGVCQADVATITTNPEGSGVFECDFTTVENAGTDDLVGTVTFTVTLLGAPVTENVASITVRAAEVEEPLEEPVEEPEVEEPEEPGDGVNHGHCVSYWSHRAKDEGLKGRAKGAFVSSIARDKDAVSSKVEDGGEPDETCDFAEQLEEALAAQSDDAQDSERKQGARSKAKGPKGADDGGDDVEDDEEDGSAA